LLVSHSARPVRCASGWSSQADGSLSGHQRSAGKHGSDPARSPTRTITDQLKSVVDDRQRILAAGCEYSVWRLRLLPGNRYACKKGRPIECEPADVHALSARCYSRADVRLLGFTESSHRVIKPSCVEIDHAYDHSSALIDLRELGHRGWRRPIDRQFA